MAKSLVKSDHKNALEGDLIESECPFKLGDLVTRTGFDIHKVVVMDWDDIADFECLFDSGGVYEVGEVESNIPKRYEIITKQFHPDLYRVAKRNGWIKE